MAKGRKQTNSLDSQRKAVLGSFTNIEPPNHIEFIDGDRIFFDNVIAEFAKSEWTQHQLEIAAMLARTMADLNQEQKTLREEGFISVRENGTTVENPRSRVVKSLTGDILSLRRSLALHARARSGDNRTAAKAKKGSIFSESEIDDDLIARPPMQ